MRNKQDITIPRMSWRDIMLVENRRLTPCTRPVWDEMWVFGNTFRPAGTVHRGMACFYQHIVPTGTCRDGARPVSTNRYILYFFYL
jgi:hypothetical protein